MHGMCDVSRKTMVELLSTPGRALMVAIGGASEALLAAPGTMDLILNKRQCVWPVLPFFGFCPALLERFGRKVSDICRSIGRHCVLMAYVIPSPFCAALP